MASTPVKKVVVKKTVKKTPAVTVKKAPAKKSSTSKKVC